MEAVLNVTLERDWRFFFPLFSECCALKFLNFRSEFESSTSTSAGAEYISHSLSSGRLKRSLRVEKCKSPVAPMSSGFYLCCVGRETILRDISRR